MNTLSISFGSFTLDETQQLINSSALCFPMTSAASSKTNTNHTQILHEIEYKQILTPFPEKNAIYCRRCYAKGHYAYDCFSTKTISGLPLKERIPLVIIRPGREKIEHQDIYMKPQKKSAQNICYDAEIASSLPGLYWAGQCVMYNHAYEFAENNIAVYGRYY